MLRSFRTNVILVLLLHAACSKSPKASKVIVHILCKEYVSTLSANWLPNDENILNSYLDHLFALSKQHFSVPFSSTSIKALVVPHAELSSSGLCAATAYQTLLDHNGNKNTTIKRVIILAPSHATFYNGIALPDYTDYRNALGTLPVDIQSLARLGKDSLFRKYPLAHEHEHAIDMQLPFIQKTIASCSIIPLIVGHLGLEDPWIAAAMLQRIIDEETLIVISSDFTHHGSNHDYRVFTKNIAEQLRQLDGYAVQALTQQSLRAFYDVLEHTHTSICGHEPLKLLLALLEKQYLGTTQVYTSCYYTSAHMPPNHPIDIKKLFDDPRDSDMLNSVSYVGMVFAKTQE